MVQVWKWCCTIYNMDYNFFYCHCLFVGNCFVFGWIPYVPHILRYRVDVAQPHVDNISSHLLTMELLCIWQNLIHCSYHVVTLVDSMWECYGLCKVPYHSHIIRPHLTIIYGMVATHFTSNLTLIIFFNMIQMRPFIKGTVCVWKGVFLHCIYLQCYFHIFNSLLIKFFDYW